MQLQAVTESLRSLSETGPSWQRRVKTKSSEKRRASGRVGVPEDDGKGSTGPGQSREGRDGLRKPMQWRNTDGGGFTDAGVFRRPMGCR